MKKVLTKSAVLLFAVMVIPAIAYGQTQRLIVKDDMDTTKLVITNEGKIGINTTDPQMEIDLNGGGITVNGSDTTGTQPPRLQWWDEGRIDFGFGGDGGGNLEAYGKDRGDNRKGEFRFVYGGGAFGAVRFMYYNGTQWRTVMTLDSDRELHMWNGAWSDGHTWYDGSSRELKENIRALSGKEALSVLAGLNPVTFNYKSDREEGCVGFIAEDLPDLVATNGRKSLSAVDIVAVLTKAVQEQQKMISELSMRIADLEKELNATKTKRLAYVH